MKVLQINITCGRGSTGHLAEALYKATLKEGWSARFAFSTFSATIPEAYRITSPLLDIIKKGLNTVFGRCQRHSNPATHKLISYIKKEKPDLIHLHNIHHNMVNYVKLFSFLKDNHIPTVFTLHDCAFFTGGCYHYLTKYCGTFKNKCLNCPMGRSYDNIKMSANEAYITKRSLIGDNEQLHIVCVSEWLKNEANSSYMGGMKNPPITIYNGINLEVFSPKKSEFRKKLNIAEDAFIILSTASFWNNGKGLDILMELSENLPSNCVVVLAGSQLENVKHRNIITIDKTESQQELAELYSVADVFVNASIEETFGLTTAEALACGTPAIVFNSTACPEIVDESTGIVIEKDLEQLITAIKTIKEKGKSFYSENCVNRAKSLFDEKIMTDKYIDLYRSILND